VAQGPFKSFSLATVCFVVVILPALGSEVKLKITLKQHYALSLVARGGKQISDVKSPKHIGSRTWEALQKKGLIFKLLFVGGEDWSLTKRGRVVLMELNKPQ